MVMMKYFMRHASKHAKHPWNEREWLLWRVSAATGRCLYPFPQLLIKNSPPTWEHNRFRNIVFNDEERTLKSIENKEKLNFI